MPLLPVSLPRQGMVLSLVSILSNRSLWFLVDFQLGEARRILAEDEPGPGEAPRKLIIVEQSSQTIPGSDLSMLEQIGGEIWAQKESLPSQRATDSIWELWLLDGGDVRSESGAGITTGLAGEIQRTMWRLFDKRAAPSK